MKKLLFGAIIILFLYQVVISQVILKPYKEQIADIDKKRQEIRNNISNYRQTQNHTDSNGYSYVYKQDTALKLIMIEYKDRRDTGKYIDKKVEWYFSNGHLIYSEQIWTDIATGKLVDNQKFYLDDRHMIAWIKFDNEAIDITSQEFIDIDAKVVLYGKKLMEKNK